MRAIIEIARDANGAPAKRKDIARTQDLSESYLENILIALKNAGVINAIRGAQGGYVLRRPASDITLFDVVEALEGSFAPVECVKNVQACDRVSGCITRDVWKKLYKAQKETLESMTVQDLLEMGKKEAQLNYTI
jgi:Rrf2 family transcriptional regulator, cysteine metabolism repressor